MLNRNQFFSRSQKNIQSRLLILAALFLGLYSISLTLSPAIAARSWDVNYPWRHWVGFGVVLIGFGLTATRLRQSLPNSDPYLFPIIGLMTGWGTLTIWRLTPTFGIRQTIWVGLALFVIASVVKQSIILNFLRRYKYIWLTSGLALTALTLIFGTNPMNFGPRLWLGCCGIYFQPSEPLKLLLVVYLAAYFADWISVINTQQQIAQRFHVLVPTLIMVGIALLLLLVQRDLGTASIFIYIYSVMIYAATGWRWIPLISTGTLAGAGVLGYAVFDVIRIRVDAWLNPWLDPAGRSYQIIQSLIAIANGGMIGRGPGMGNPEFVPVAHSDFIFTAITEETGLLGAVGLLALLGLLAHRGFRIAFQATNTFQRYLATGITTHLVAQSILIIGGNLRLLPLTGVTLPFVSYGGSSLLISFIEILLLLQISAAKDEIQPLPAVSNPKSIIALNSFLLLGIIGAALVTGWWAYVRGPDLLTRTDNPRRTIDDQYVYRGAILDRNNTALAETWGKTGNYFRHFPYPNLSPILGYTHPIYGQTGLEASLDPYLRGTQGNDPYEIWWHHLLYGQPPPGLDIRLTIDLPLQTESDSLLQDQRGALILLDAKTGEILVMASHPTYDANQLDEIWDDLIQDSQSPLINRVTQGSYPTGNLGGLLFSNEAANSGFDIYPQFRLPVTDDTIPGETASPMQVVVAAAALSNGGVQPAPQIAQMVQNPDGGWYFLEPLGKSIEILSSSTAQSITRSLADDRIWKIVYTPDDENLTWYIAGTLPGDENPRVLVLVLENENVPLAEETGDTIFNSALIR